MTARLPSVSTTESSAVNSTSAVVSGWMEILSTLPTSTPAIRTKSPVSNPVTFVNAALYAVAFSPKRNCPNTAYKANTPSRHTARKMPRRHRACRQSLLMAGCLSWSVWLVLGRSGRWRGLLRQWNRRQRCRLHLRGRRDHERLGAWRRARVPRRARRRRRRQARPKRGAIRRVHRRAVGRGTRVGNRTGRGPAAQVADARRLGDRARHRQPVAVGREPDARVGPPIDSGSETGVRDELSHRPVLGDVGQRTTARLATRSALGTDDGQVVRIAVRVVTEENRWQPTQASVEDERSPITAGRFVTSVVQQRLGAEQQTGVLRVVLVQQVRRRLEYVDGLDQVGLTRCEQFDATVGEPNGGQEQGVK